MHRFSVGLFIRVLFGCLIGIAGTAYAAGPDSQKAYPKVDYSEITLVDDLNSDWLKEKLGTFDLPKRPRVRTGPVIHVEPGENIQDAIDRIAKRGGGVVRLGTGTHHIKKSIQLTSNLILEGTGSNTVITRKKLDRVQTMIKFNGGGLQDVILRHFTIDGARSRKERGTNSWTWPRGILMTDGETDNRRILVFDLRIKRCSYGFHAKGTDDLIVKNVNLFNNGCKHKYAHNFYLRRNQRVVVRDSRFTDSHTGNGINLYGQTYIVLLNNKVLNNKFRGLRAANSSKVVMFDNLAVGNGAFGIGTRTENGGVSDYLLVNNVSAKNGGSNYSMKHSSGGTEENNKEQLPEDN